MPVVTGAGLARNYGAEEIFAAVTFEIQDRARIALVGANGSGKTSLLRLIAGQERPDRGTLTLGRGLRIGYLPQEVTFPPGQTLSDYMLGAFGHLFAVEAELRAVEAALGAGGADGSQEAQDGVAPQRRVQLVRRRAGDASGPEHLGAGEAPAGQQLLQIGADGLDFGKLRHRFGQRDSAEARTTEPAAADP